LGLFGEKMNAVQIGEIYLQKGAKWAKNGYFAHLAPFCK